MLLLEVRGSIVANLHDTLGMSTEVGPAGYDATVALLTHKKEHSHGSLVRDR